MAEAEKTLEKWKQRIPKEARWNEVEKVLNSYFPSNWRWGKGSHVVVCEPRVATLFEKLKGKSVSELPPFNYKGEFDLVVHGKSVKAVDIRKIIMALKIREGIIDEEES